MVQIRGSLGHDSEKGDGVRGHIVSSIHGSLGSWTAKKQRQETKLDNVKVARGEIIDFIVESGESVDSDTFTWVPVLKVAGADGQTQNGQAIEWNARQDFSGPKEIPQPLDPWEKPYVYKMPGEKGEYDLVSFGKDGQPGGSGEAADIANR